MTIEPILVFLILIVLVGLLLIIVSSTYFPWHRMDVSFDKSMPAHSEEIHLYGDDRFQDPHDIRPHSAKTECLMSRRRLRVEKCPGQDNPFEINEFKGLFITSHLHRAVGWCRAGEDVCLFELKRHPFNPRALHAQTIEEYLPRDTIIIVRVVQSKLPT